MEVGELITLYRKQAGMTIEDLADRSGVPKGTLNKIIGGVTKAPTLPNMKAIAKALGKTLEDFDDLPIQKTEQPTENGGLSKKELKLFKSIRGLAPNERELAIDLCSALVLELLRHHTVEEELKVASPAGLDR